MGKIETLEELYQRKFDWIPDTIRHEIGHFNVLLLYLFVGERARAGFFCIFNHHFFNQFGRLDLGIAEAVGRPNF